MSHLNSTVHDAFAVIEAFDPDHPVLGDEELLRATGLSPEAFAAATQSLVALDYLRKADSGLWRLGPRNIALARNFLGAHGVVEVAQGHLEAVATRFRAVAALSERSQLEMVYVGYVRAGASVVVEHRVGSRISIAVSAAGRAWVCSAPALEVAAVLDEVQGMYANWRHLMSRFEDARQDLSTRGFTRSYGEVRAGVNSVAVPMKSPIDGSIVVFSLAIKDSAMTSAECDAVLGPALIGTVEQIRRELAA